MSNDNNPEVEQEQEYDTSSEEEEAEEQEASEEEEEAQEGDDESDEELDRLRQENAKYKRLLKKRNDRKTPQKVTNNSAYDERIERLELRQEGYSEDVINEIMKLGGKSALENKIVANAVKDLVEQETAEKAANVDGGSQSVTKSKYTVDELKNMSSEEMEKHLPKS